MILYDRLSAAEQDRCMEDVPVGELFWLLYAEYTSSSSWDRTTMLWRREPNGVVCILGERDLQLRGTTTVKPLNTGMWLHGNGVVALDEGESARLDMLLTMGHDTQLLREEVVDFAVANGRRRTEK